MYLGVAENLAYDLMTLLTASRKSFSVATLRRARIANIPASVQTDRISAPVLLGQRRASNSNLISLSTLIERAWILKMCVRPSRSGRPNSIFLSKRPGRISAGSNVSGLFVAIRTFMLPRGSNLKQKRNLFTNKSIKYKIFRRGQFTHLID